MPIFAYTDEIFFTLEPNTDLRSSGNQAADGATSLLIAPIPQNILNYAIEVIGSYDAAMKWFITPSTATGSNPPIYFMLTEKGSEQVQNELLRIEAGVL